MTPSNPPLLQRGRAVLAALAVALLAAVGLGSCGSGQPGATKADNRDGLQATVFDGRFEQLPLMPRAEPVGDRSEKDGVTTRSYEVRGATTDSVMAFYQKVLPSKGWTVSQPVRASGTSTQVGVWVTPSWRLRVSSNDAPALGSAQDPTQSAKVQYSLELSER